MNATSLISRYETTVRGVETQSCNCGGKLREGDAWRSGGCGWSPEYENDIEVRSKIERLIQVNALGAAQVAQIAAIDSRLKKLLTANGVSVAGPDFWHNGIPLGIAE